MEETKQFTLAAVRIFFGVATDEDGKTVSDWAAESKERRALVEFMEDRKAVLGLIAEVEEITGDARSDA